MDFDHVRSYAFQVDDHQHVSKAGRMRDVVPWITICIAVLRRTRLPHRIVPGAGTFGRSTVVSGWMSHIAWSKIETQWKEPDGGTTTNQRRRKRHEGDRREKKEREEEKKRRNTRRRTQGRNIEIGSSGGPLVFRRSMRFSFQPQVPQVGEHGHIGPFVFGCPSGSYIPGDHDHDVVWRRSPSTKDRTWCPALSSLTLDHQRWSMDGMEDHKEHQVDLAGECGRCQVVVHVDLV